MILLEKWSDLLVNRATFENVMIFDVKGFVTWSHFSDRIKSSENRLPLEYARIVWSPQVQYHAKDIEKVR